MDCCLELMMCKWRTRPPSNARVPWTVCQILWNRFDCLTFRYDIQVNIHHDLERKCNLMMLTHFQCDHKMCTSNEVLHWWREVHIRENTIFNPRPPAPIYKLFRWLCQHTHEFECNVKCIAAADNHHQCKSIDLIPSKSCLNNNRFVAY